MTQVVDGVKRRDVLLTETEKLINKLDEKFESTIDRQLQEQNQAKAVIKSETPLVVDDDTKRLHLIELLIVQGLSKLFPFLDALIRRKIEFKQPGVAIALLMTLSILSEACDRIALTGPSHPAANTFKVLATFLRDRG